MLKRIARKFLHPVLENRRLNQWAVTIDSSKKGQREIVRDYLRLFNTKGITMDEYYDFEMEKRSEEFRNSFLGKNEQRYYLDQLNPIKYSVIARNKYLTHKMLENVGVPKTTLYCYYMPEARYISNEECASTLVDVLRILKTKNVSSCVTKTTEGTHGDNVWVFKKIEFREDDAVMTRFDGKELLLSSLLGKDALIFESMIKQTKQFSSLNKTSVNTIRFITTLWPNGTVKVIASWSRIGREGKCVDNAGSGGNIDAAVDLETGEICNVIQFDGWRNIKEINNHPDNGNVLNGTVIENWQAIKEEVKIIQQSFPYCKAAGWDIAITDDGPVIIEVNDFWDLSVQYFIRHGLRNEIRECYFAWKNAGVWYNQLRNPSDLPKETLERIISK